MHICMYIGKTKYSNEEISIINSWVLLANDGVACKSQASM